MQSSYHLWLKPSGKAHDVLAEAIQDLSHKLRSPIFEPHVTLLSGLQGSEQDHLLRTEQLADWLQPLHISLIAPSYQDTYFQCLFLKVEETPPVMEAHARAKAAFADKAEAAFMPHLSLLYGLYSREVKQEIIATLPSHLRMTFDATALYLTRSDSDDPKDWHEILMVPMGSGK
jgi:2'-5' RNA ligase